MEDLNEIIAEKIRTAREERELTQKQVASALGYKSSNAVSEIERNKVKVSAADLYILSEYFNKPLLYFFGREFKDTTTEDLIAILEKLSEDEIKGLQQLVVSQARMREIGALLATNPELQTDRDLQEEALENLNAFLIPLSRQLEQAYKAKEVIEIELGIKKP